MRGLFSVLLLFASLSPCLASDGVLEINQTCAEGPGCFDGDDPGFPVRIINSGSYVLTSDLDVPAEGTGIITLPAKAGFLEKLNVSLDMNGFSISSTTTCEGSPPICAPATVPLDGVGIYFAVSDSAHFLIHDGVVHGMASRGITCSPGCTIRNVKVWESAGTGILMDGLIESSQVFVNGGVGIGISTGPLRAENCIVRDNGGAGFAGGNVFTNNIVEDNVNYGIQGGPGAVVIGNHVLALDETIALRCSECSAHNNALRGQATGIDFEGTAGIFGGNQIDATVPLVNDGSAVQSSPNVCGAAACPP